MNVHYYYIVDEEGYLLCTIVSRPTSADFDDNAKLFVVDLLNVDNLPVSDPGAPTYNVCALSGSRLTLDPKLSLPMYLLSSS